MTTNPYQPPKDMEKKAVTMHPQIGRIAKGYVPAAVIGALGGIAYMILMGINRLVVFDLDTYAPLSGASLGVGIYYLFHCLATRRGVQHLPPETRVASAAITAFLIVLVVAGVLFACWLTAFMFLFTAFV